MQVLERAAINIFCWNLIPNLWPISLGRPASNSKLRTGKRTLSVDLLAVERQAPLLLFDAADPGNLGWFSRCQFYVDGRTGSGMQTPPAWRINGTGADARCLTRSRTQMTKELPGSFRMPGRQPVNEQVIYAILFNLLNALLNTGVGVCGGPGIKPLAGRTEHVGQRN